MRVESSYSENTIDFSKWFTEKPLTLWEFVQKHFINFSSLFDTSKDILKNVSKIMEDNFYSNQKTCLSYYLYGAQHIGVSTVKNIISCYYVYLFFMLERSKFPFKETVYLDIFYPCDLPKTNALECNSLFNTLNLFDFFKNQELTINLINSSSHNLDTHIVISDRFAHQVVTRPITTVQEYSNDTLGIIFTDDSLINQKSIVSNIETFKSNYKKNDTLFKFSILGKVPESIFSDPLDQFIEKCSNNVLDTENIIISFKPYWYVKKPQTSKYFLFDTNNLSIVDTENDHTIKVPDELLCKNGISYRQLASKDPQILLNYYIGQPVRCLKPIIKELLSSLENCENILKYKLPEMEQIKNQFSELKKAIKAKLSNPIGE